MAYPVDPHARPVFYYRWAVFLLAAFFSLRQVVFVGDYSDPGGPFRFLTVWALLLSFFCAGRMLAITERRTERSWSTLVAVTAVVNALVVLLYWRLRLEDPSLVRSGAPLPWWVDGYLHGLGALLQWFDALVLYGAFRRPWVAIAPFLLVVFAYVGWIEGFVGPANAYPLGQVTDGLPYPFLNNLQPEARLAFYAKTAATGIGFLALFWGLSAGLRRLRG